MSVSFVPDPNPLYIDDRAGSIDLLKFEPLLSGATYCRLDSGDAMWCGNGPDGPILIGVEVKSIHDLISSMSTGRLQDTQLRPLLESYQDAWLLVWGQFGAKSDGSMWYVTKRGDTRLLRHGSKLIPFGYVQSFLFTLSAVGLKIAVVPNQQSAAHWLGCLHRWWTKPWDKHKGLRAFDRSNDIALMPNMDEDVHWLAQVALTFPGVGYDRALAAANHFRSGVQLMCAPAAEWAQIPGVGKIIASKAEARARKERF